MTNLEGAFSMIKKKSGRLTKAITILWIAMTAIFMFVACNPDDLTQYKTDAKAAIDAHISALREDDYTTEDWAIIRQRADEGKTAVDNAEDKIQVDAAVHMTKNSMSLVLSKDEEMKNFVMTISTQKASFSKNEEIKVEISLINRSGADAEIAYYFLITPEIPTATGYPVSTEMPPEPYIRFFQNDETIRIINDLGGYFDIGKHEIKYKAAFFLNLGEENESRVEILSNTIIIAIN